MARPNLVSLDLLGLVLLIAVCGVVFWKLAAPQAQEQPVPPGTVMPRIEPAGWLNVPDGESFDPTGKVVVVDLWATYCPPCRAEIPRLAEVVREYRPLGVEFVGLTDEMEADVPGVQKFIEATPGFDWPVGYGAGQFMLKLNIRQIPTLIVFGADGRARWSWAGQGAEQLREELDMALLAAKKAEEKRSG